uniref:Uncharacterized protein n=1 Tax=Tanacetum cinerariifolium TaxID=118510 RepID=A0A6L2JA42_TANCI|nr:hypothetical protein [Tanacetum cinerariifolium]
MVEFIQSGIHPNTRAHLSRDGGNSQMMGHVGPTTALAIPEILTIQVDVFQQEAWEKYPQCYTKRLDSLKKLEQSLLLGGREGVPDCRGLSPPCRSRSPPVDRHCQSGDKNGGPGRSHSSGVPSTIERSPLDFANENPSQQSTGPEDQEVTAPEVLPSDNVTTIGIAPRAGSVEMVAATSPSAVIERRKRGHDGVDTNAPPKVLRRDHADPRPTKSTHGGKSLAAIELGMGSTRPILTPQGAPVDVNNPDPLSFADPQSRAAAARDPKSKNTSFASMVGYPESIYRPEWYITNGCLLDVPEACQDLVDHIAPPGYFLELRHLHNDEFLKQYNVNLARQIAMGSQLRLRSMIRRGLRLVVMKCGESTELRQAFANVVSARIAKGMSEGLKHRVENEQAKLDLEAIEAYDPKAEANYIWVRELRPSSSQLTILVYLKVRNPMDPWACIEEILLADAIAANVSRTEMKKKCRVGLAILLADAATQTETSDEASSQLLMSSSLPVIHV